MPILSLYIPEKNNLYFLFLDPKVLFFVVVLLSLSQCHIHIIIVINYTTVFLIDHCQAQHKNLSYCQGPQSTASNYDDIFIIIIIIIIKDLHYKQ